MTKKSCGQTSLIPRVQTQPLHPLRFESALLYHRPVAACWDNERQVYHERLCTRIYQKCMQTTHPIARPQRPHTARLYGKLSQLIPPRLSLSVREWQSWRCVSGQRSTMNECNLDPNMQFWCCNKGWYTITFFQQDFFWIRRRSYNPRFLPRVTTSRHLVEHHGRRCSGVSIIPDNAIEVN